MQPIVVLVFVYRSFDATPRFGTASSRMPLVRCSWWDVAIIEPLVAFTKSELLCYPVPLSGHFPSPSCAKSREHAMSPGLGYWCSRKAGQVQFSLLSVDRRFIFTDTFGTHPLQTTGSETHDTHIHNMPAKRFEQP